MARSVRILFPEGRYTGPAEHYDTLPKNLRPPAEKVAEYYGSLPPRGAAMAGTNDRLIFKRPNKDDPRGYSFIVMPDVPRNSRYWYYTD